MSNPYPQVSLAEVLTQYTDYIDAPQPKSYPKLSVKLYGKGVVLDGPADGSTLKMKRHQIARAGQVILSEIWGKKGAIGFVPPEGEGALCTSHFFLFDVRTDRLVPGYLRAIFTANYLEAQLGTEAKGTTGYAAVRPKHLLAARIPLPPLDEQCRIVSRIDELAASVEEARGLREKACRVSEILETAVLRRFFAASDGLKNVRLEDVCEAIIDNLHSNPVYADSGIPCVRSPDVGWGDLYLDRARCTTEDEYKRRTIRGEPRLDDVVFVREGGGTGKAALVKQGQRFSLGQRVMMIRPRKDLVLPKFLLYQLLSPQIFEDQILELTKGSASPHLNIGALKKFTFLLPSRERQTEIVSYLDHLKMKVNYLQRLQCETATELDALMPSILSKAFRGEL
jgi:type I restriction enzyme S subunit